MEADESMWRACEANLRVIAGFERTELLRLEDGLAVLRAYPREDSANEFGIAHGGFLMAIADEAAACAADTTGRPTVTMSESCNFMRPVPVIAEGSRDSAYAWIDATAEVTHAGRTSVVIDVRIARPDGKVALSGTFTMAVLPDALES